MKYTHRISQNMKSLIKLIQSDNEHWKVELGKSRISFFLLFLLLREYRIVVLFRIVQYLRKNRIFVILYFFMRFLYRCYTLKNGCEIPSSTKIGGGLLFIIVMALLLIQNQKLVTI